MPAHQANISCADDPALPICDDNDWEECDRNDLAASSAALPPVVAKDLPVTASTGLEAAPAHAAVLPMPLDARAMAHVEDADPFHMLLSIPNTSWSAWSMTHPSVVLAMILVTWLHLVAHFPFCFCDVVLSMIGYILVDAGQANLTPLLCTSLTGCLSAL